VSEVLTSQGQFVDAAALLREGISEHSTYETRAEWALAELAAAGEKAERSLRRALSLDPGNSQALVNLCTLLAGLDRALTFDEPTGVSSQPEITGAPLPDASPSLLLGYPKSFPNKYEGRTDGMFWLSPGSGVLSVSVDAVLHEPPLSPDTEKATAPEEQTARQSAIHFLREGHFAAAIQQFEQALTQREDSDTWNDLAVAQLAAGFQLAHHELRRSLSHDPGSFPLRMQLVALLVRLGRDRDALALLECASQLDGDRLAGDEGFTIRRWRASCRGELASILFYGNCNAPILASAMAGLPEIREKFEPRGYVTFPLPGASHPEPPPEDIMARCELLFLQVEARNAEPPFVERLESLGVKVVRFPITSCEVLWPQACTDHRNDVFDERYPWGRYPYGDRLLLDLMTRAQAQAQEQALTPDEIVETYLSTDLAEMFHVQRVYEYWRKKIAKLDAQCDVKLGHFIDQQFREQRLFYTHNHPTPAIMAYLLQEMIRLAWGDVIPSSKIQAAAAAIPLDRHMSPVHPSIAAALGLRWANDDLRYRHYDNGFFTLPEIVRRYVTWEG
jgi:tetratricopeptide (TPR) repeat protein